MDFVKLSEQRFTAKKFDVNKKIPRDDVEKLKTILQLSPSSVNSQPWVFLWGTSDNSNVNFQRFPTLDAKKLVNAPKMSAHHRGICHF